MDRAAEFLAVVDAVNRRRASRSEAEQVLALARLAGQPALAARAERLLRVPQLRTGGERRPDPAAGRQSA